MELACTKKLLEYIGIKPEKASAEIDPLFEWTANLMVINRRKALVVVHAASRCAFVLYGLTAKNKTELPELVLTGIRRLLESEYMRPEIIDQYLKELGQEVSLRANSSRKTVASCNKACERVEMFSELLQTDELYQQSIQLWLNNDILGNKYAHSSRKRKHWAAAGPIWRRCPVLPGFGAGSVVGFAHTLQAQNHCA